jgi:hypothetical protein
MAQIDFLNKNSGGSIELLKFDSVDYKEIMED